MIYTAIKKKRGRKEESIIRHIDRQSGRLNFHPTVKRRTWEEFLHKADGNNVWSVMTYTKPQRGTAVPTISHEGATANTLEEKSDMLLSISFPAPIPYEGGEGEPGPPGQAYRLVDSRLAATAFKGTSTKKSPGPDGISPLAIRCLYDWEADRIEAIIRTHIRLEIHPEAWKTAGGQFRSRERQTTAWPRHIGSSPCQTVWGKWRRR